VKPIIIPGHGTFELENIVLDLNGTITESGAFIPGVEEGFEALRRAGFKIFVLSGDTKGTLSEILQGFDYIETVLSHTAQDKKTFVESIGPERTACVGNGNIDVEMFKVARLSICTVQGEGATTKALLHADMVVTHIRDAIEILVDPHKLIATLRS
jgi:soluble P-type ATPase